MLSGTTCRLIPGKLGLLEVGDLRGKIRADNQHFCRSRLVCLENTTNVGGGRYYPLGQFNDICHWARENGLKVHLDGARLFNAVVAVGYSAAEICRNVDTVSVCFSKGLGCPMGSVLAGSKEEVYKARRARKLFGGALRQAGIPAASALYALQNHVERLKDDHDNARALAAALREIDGITLDPPDVQTNLVFFQVDAKLGYASQLSGKLKQLGVLINASGPQRLRACTHLDVSREDIPRAAQAVAQAVKEGFSHLSGHPSGPYARG